MAREESNASLAHHQKAIFQRGLCVFARTKATGSRQADPFLLTSLWRGQGAGGFGFQHVPKEP